MKNYKQPRIAAPAHKAVKHPAAFAREIMRWKGWAVFQCEDYYDKGRRAYIAVHEDTREERHFDVTSLSHVHHDRQMFRDLIDLGFPTRSAAGTIRPLTANDIETLKAPRPNHQPAKES